jgi:branched-chain amino acid transport system substrate-binding protein
VRVTGRSHSSRLSRNGRRTLRTGFALVATFAVVVLVAALLVSLTQTSSASGALGAIDQAGGTPVTIGMIIDGHDGGSGGTDVERGARMAVDYENEYGGGLDGHKIVLHFCANDDTSVGGYLCATNMVQRGVVAVIEPSSAQGQSEVPPLVQAGIPYIAMTGGSAAELTTAGAFALQGGVPAILGAVAEQAKQRGYAKVTVIIENQPSVVLGAQVIGDIVFKAAGVGFDVLTANPSATNLKPELETALSGGASAVGVGGNTGFCRAFLRAYASLHAHVPKYVISTCLGSSILDSAPLDKVLSGSMLAGAETSSPRDDALYAGIVQRYAPAVNPDPDVSSNDFAGVVPVLSLAAIMKGAPAGEPVTAGGVLARTEAAKNVAIPLFGGARFTCDGAAIPILKSVCSSTAAIGVLGHGDHVTHIHVYDPAALY